MLKNNHVNPVKYVALAPLDNSPYLMWSAALFNGVKKIVPRILTNALARAKTRKLKGAKLIVFGLLAEIIYLLFYLIEPLKKYLGDTALALSNCYLFLAIVGLLTIALAVYIFTYKLVADNNACFKTIIIFFVLFNLTLLFVWPMGSVDIFSYIGWSRVLSEHSANPYLMPYGAFPHDAFYQQINNIWLSQPAPYGPLFVIIGSAITFLGSNSLLLNLFLFKLFFVIINILNCLLVHKTFKNNKITFLYAWNPLILYEFAVNGHSDILTIFFLLISLFFLLRQQNKLRSYILSWVFLLLSVLIKYMTLIFLPIFFLIALFNLKQKKEKIVFFFVSAAISIFVLFVFYRPFLGEANALTTLFSYLLYPFKAGKIAGLAIYPPILTVMLSSVFSFFKIVNYYNWSVIISRIAFIIFYGAMMLQLFIKRDRLNQEDIVKYFCLALAVFLATFFSWVLPWYYALLIVLLIYCSAISKYKYNNFIYGITFFSILYYLFLR